MHVAHAQIADVCSALPEAGICLSNNPIHAAQHVEVIHIDGAQIGLQGVEDRCGFDALGLGFGSIQFHFQLRYVGLIGTDRERHARGARHFGLECLQRFLQRGIPEPAAIGQKQ